MFGYAFDRLKSAFNIQKVCLKKKKFVFKKKKIKTIFNNLKSLKNAKIQF
jgi:hypothetical protein